MKKIVIAALAAFLLGTRCLVDAGGSAVLVERLCLALLASPRFVAVSPPPS